jgi:Tfp pilus assembly protein PilO
MKKLSPAKRNQLLMVLLGTVALICAVYFLLIGPQNEDNQKLLKAASDKENDLGKMKSIIKQAAVTAGQLVEVSNQLNHAEADIASGDAYAWTYDTIRQFKSAYPVDIPGVGLPSIGDVDLLPNFPYKQIRVSMNGTAYYHDLGKFVADFENNFPHMRLVNLSVEPSANTDNSGTEKLSFRMDVIALVKPNS